MKKSRGHKKVNSSKKRKKFLSRSKFSVLAVIATFLFFTFLLGTVYIGQPTGNVITGNAIKTNYIFDLFTQWGAGQLDVNIAKYLFFFMLMGIIWGALYFADFPPSKAFQALIAIPAAFLATAYITPAEVFTILQSYTAMGITLTFLLPFIIMVLVSGMLVVKTRISKMNVASIVLEVFLWFFFIVILIYKMFEGFITKQISFGLNLVMIIMMGVIVLSALILLFNGKFRAWLWKINLQLLRVKGASERVIAEEAAMTAKGLEKERGRTTFGGGGI